MILFDTHVLIWFISNPEKLSSKAQRIIEKEIKAKRQFLVSSISIWEIYMLVKRDRLKLAIDTDSWVRKIEQTGSFHFISIDNQIAAKSVVLNNSFHDDPADRMIVATALHLGAILITSDQKILNYPNIQAVW